MFRDLVLTRMPSNNWRETSNSVRRKRIITDKLWLMEDQFVTLFSTFPVVRNVIFASHIFPLELSTICSQATHTTRWSNVTHFSKVRKSRLAEYSIKQYCQTRECEMLLPVLLIINLYLFLLLEMISAHVLDHIISERNLLIAM